MSGPGTRGAERDAVRAIFDSRGLAPNTDLMVHAGFKRLAAAGMRCEAFIEALIEALAQGTVLMPTMTWRLVTSDHRFFSEMRTPSITGALSEVFRTAYAATRSLHPTHSVAAYGARAAELTAEHALDPTPCSPRSPFGKLAAGSGHILSIDTDLTTCTLIHCAEELVAPERYFRPGGEIYYCQDRRNVVHPVFTRRHRPLDRDFPKFEAPMAARGALTRGEIAGIPWILYAAADLHDIALANARRDPDATLRGVPVIDRGERPHG